MIHTEKATVMLSCFVTFTRLLYIGIRNRMVYRTLIKRLLRVRIGSIGFYREGHVLNNKGLPNLIKQSLV